MNTNQTTGWIANTNQAPPAQSEILYAQQPILDVNQELVAYELLFRGNFDEVDGFSASARVLLNAFDEGHFTADSMSVPLFVNFTEELLFNVPPFDTSYFVIELLETIEPSERVIQQVKALKALGYRIALDDFTYSAAMIPLLKCADIVKIDVMATPVEKLSDLVDTLRGYGLTLLAEKVEDHEMFEVCKKLRFDWYQGYFFARPKPIQGRSVGPNKAAVLTMVSALQSHDLDLRTLEDIIAGDSGLTYKVLKLSNSAATKRAVPIDSIGKAIAMLGLRRLQNFSTLMTLSELGEKPSQLQVYTTQRSLLCERLGGLLPTEIGSEVFRTVGILSCCDAYFDEDLEQLIPNLPLSDDVTDAILKHEGELGTVLRATQALQESRWNDVDWATLELIGLSEAAILEVVRETSSWAESNTEVELW